MYLLNKFKKSNKIILLIIAIFLTYKGAFASDWEALWYGVSIDKDSITQINSDEYKFWLRMIKNNDNFSIFIPVENYLRKEILYSNMLANINCRTKQLKFIYINNVATNGSVISSVNIPNPKYEDIVPDSSGDKYYEMICKSK